MIQRIQSVYLVLGALALASLFFFGTLFSSGAAAAYAWFSPVLLILDAVIVIAAVASIFLYKNRAQQRKVVLGVQILTLLFIVVLYAGLFLSNELVFFGASAGGAGVVLSILLPIAAYILFFLARKGIEKDIALVRSMDRLR